MTTHDVPRDIGFKPAKVAKEELEARLRANRHMSEVELERFALLAGRSVRTVYRWKEQILDQLPEPPKDTRPVLIRLIEDGENAEFEWDKLMIRLVYSLKGNFSELHRQFEDAGIWMPSVSTLSRMWTKVPPLEKDGARYGLKHRTEHALYVRRTTRPALNTFWHYDATILDIWVLDPDGNPCKPHWTAVVDAGDSFCTGWMVLPHKANTADVKAFLASAIEVRPSPVDPTVNIGGLPDTLVTDNAGEYGSEEMVEALAAIGRVGRAIPVATPEANGIVERNGMQTLQQLIVTGIAGEVTRAENRKGQAAVPVVASKLLTWRQFVDHCTRRVHHYNYERAHSGLGGRTPFDVRRHCEYLAELPIEELALLWKPIETREGKRKIHGKGGVKMTIAGDVVWFNTEELDQLNLVGQFVYPRMLHHDETRIALFDEYDRFLCIAERDLDKARRGHIVGRRRMHEKEVETAHRAAAVIKEANTDRVRAGDDPNVVQALLGFTGMVAARDAEPEAGVRHGVAPTGHAPKSSKKKGRGPAASLAESELKRRALEAAAEALGVTLDDSNGDPS